MPAKRKTQSGPASPAKKVQKVEDDDDDDFVMPQSKKKEATPSKKLKNASGKGIPQELKSADESDDDEAKGSEAPHKSGGRGRGGRGSSSAAPAGGRGRGAGRGGFMNFGERKDPPHKGEKVLCFQNLELINERKIVDVNNNSLFACSRMFLKVIQTV